MEKIKALTNCYGCGLCSVVCNHNVIGIRMNEDGFYQPVIDDSSSCVHCGLCESICSYINESECLNPIKSYAGWSNDNNVRRNSTSGGVSFELGRYLLSIGYKFCGVKYNPNSNRTEHYIASSLDDLQNSQGSKYLQSYTVDAFRFINRKEKYIVVGTPCQIASFRRYINKYHVEDNFLLIDFFCHGIPSYLLWQKYVEEHSNALGPISNVSWRDKTNGWHNSYGVKLTGALGTHKSDSEKDAFITYFLGDACLNEACYGNCKFKCQRSFADVRIGDFWGKHYLRDEKGVNAILVYSDKGNAALENASLCLIEHPITETVSGQMTECAEKPYYYPLAKIVLHSKRIPLDTLLPLIKMHKRITGYYNKLKSLVTK